MTEPNGCRWCGVGERVHASRFAESVGQHLYATPTDEQRMERMTDHDPRRQKPEAEIETEPATKEHA